MIIVFYDIMPNDRWEYETADWEDREFIVRTLMHDQNITREKAEWVFNNVIKEYELIDQFYENCEDDAKDYFHKFAEDEYYDALDF